MEYITGAILLGMAILSQWLLTPSPSNNTVTETPESDRQKEKAILLLLDLVFFLASIVSPQMPVMLRWSLWFACWIITVILVQLHFDKPKAVDRKVCEGSRPEGLCGASRYIPIHRLFSIFCAAAMDRGTIVNNFRTALLPFLGRYLLYVPNSDHRNRKLWKLIYLRRRAK